MRPFAGFVLGALALSLLYPQSPLIGVAHAQSQSPAPARENKGYVEGVAQSAFGNVTSQSFGLELGFTLVSPLQVFVDAGYVRDTAPSDLGASAQLIAGFLSQTQNNVAFTGKEPVTFGVVGLRYLIPVSSKLQPYVLAGGGVAQVKKDVSFSIAGNDVTSTLPQYGVVLGSDLSGTETKPMVSVGGGVVWNAWQTLIVDFQYRYGRVFTSDQGLNVNRAGVGIGVRF
jgi:opacity protein-like surface antigen